MTIQYYLLNNQLSDEPNQQIARVQTRGKKDLDDIVRLIVTRGSTLGEPDIHGVLTELGHVILAMLEEGNAVYLPFATFKSKIKGTFVNHNDGYDPSRHMLLPNIAKGPILKKLYGGNILRVEKIDHPNNKPELKSFVDMSSGAYNETVTPGGMGSLIGKRMRFNEEGDSEGVYLVDTTTQEATKAPFVGLNSATKQAFLIPSSLSPGEYFLEVRVAHGEKIAIGRLDDRLTVA